MDDAELSTARQQWKLLKDQDSASLRYFQQTDKGSWEEKQLN
jgi:DNA polymerase IIIc chi subunit